MDSGVIRDFIISITGGLMLVLLILVAILGFLLYRQIKKLTELIKGTIKTVKALDTEMTGTIKSTKEIFSMFTGKKKEEETAKTK